MLTGAIATPGARRADSPRGAGPGRRLDSTLAHAEGADLARLFSRPCLDVQGQNVKFL